jgi:hypothetical protein
MPGLPWWCRALDAVLRPLPRPGSEREADQYGVEAMTYSFKKAVRGNEPLLISLAGASGSGKTYSAMRLATGLAGDGRFAVVDTENGRARLYADLFDFDTVDLVAPFRPQSYDDAIQAADAAGYPVIVVDSFSHEHAGDGGLLDWHDEELARMGGRASSNIAAWIEPKRVHKRLVTHLLQVKAHVIICLRAEEKIEMVKGAGGKIEVVKKKSLTGLDGWIPICEKSLPFEMTASFLLVPDKPGVPQPIKLMEQHRALFSINEPLSEETGAALAAWAAGGKKKAAKSSEGGEIRSEAPPSDDPADAKEAELFRLVDLLGAGEATRDLAARKRVEFADNRTGLLDWIDRCTAKAQKQIDAKLEAEKQPEPEQSSFAEMAAAAQARKGEPE